jgi:uncharacterized protein DUF4189
MTRCLLLFSLLALCGVALGQTACPGGVSLGDPRCGPSPSGHGSSSPTLPRGPQWQLTWGAIAMDLTTGDVGAGVGFLSRGKAKGEAMTRCSANGAKKCQIQLAFKNQCAVVAWPSRTGIGVIAQSGSSIEEASQVALSRCASHSGSECKIVYSDCTVPVLMNR